MGLGFESLRVYKRKLYLSRNRYLQLFCVYTFPTIIKRIKTRFPTEKCRDLLYVDKTEYVYRMTHGGGKYFFLSRPRRFGKSLLTSTFLSYFEGKKELFKGLAIEKLETEWTEYPVLHFSMASGKHLEKEQLQRYRLYILKNNEVRFGIENEAVDPNIRLSNLIRTVYQKTGKQVVVLIDEYDAPLLDVIHNEEQLQGLSHIMRNFYSPLKDCDPYLRFVFLTGITIKGYEPETELYLLDIPNKEIRVGLYRCLLPNYIGMNTVKGTTTIAKMSAAIRRHDINKALEMLQTYLATVPYCDNTDYESHYQQMMYVIFSILDNYVDVEVRTPKGRVDMVLRTATHLYLFELKLNLNADVAMKQIDLKKYPKRFVLSGLQVVKVGINFDMATHNITDWKIE